MYQVRFTTWPWAAVCVGGQWAGWGRAGTSGRVCRLGQGIDPHGAEAERREGSAV